MLLNKIKKIFIFLMSIVLLLVIGYFYENKIAYVHFVDEEENMVTAKYLINGEKLYQRVFSQHQPITYFLSSTIQKITQPNTIFMLIKRHREFIIAWSLIWALFLISRFGSKTLPAIIIIEVSKIFLLGNLFLAESLIIYPIIYLIGLCLPRAKINKLEFFLIGVIFGLCFFLLAPIWPLLIVASSSQRDWFSDIIRVTREAKSTKITCIFLFYKKTHLKTVTEKIKVVFLIF